MHVGVTCDNCYMAPIVGKRFKCLTCVDYDLCEECESLNVHTHDMFLIKNEVSREVV